MANSSTELSGSCCVKLLAYCRFPDMFIQVVSPKNFLFMSTQCAGQAQAQHLKLSSAKALLRLFFRCQRNFNFMACFKVVILKNFKSKMVKIPTKKKVQQMTFSFFLDLINMKESHNFYVGVSKPCLFVLGCL